MLTIKNLEKIFLLSKSRYFDGEQGGKSAEKQRLTPDNSQKNPIPKYLGNLTDQQKNIVKKIQSLKGLIETARNQGDYMTTFTILQYLIENSKKFIKRFESMERDSRDELQALNSDISSFISENARSIDNIEFKLGLDDEGEKLKFNNQDLINITNQKFLSLPRSSRLQYITKYNIDSQNIVNGNVEEVEFNFIFDGNHNDILYRYTTAGQVLPEEVQEVESSGQRYKRDSLKGEFFKKNGERLTIHQGTKIKILTLRNKQALEEIENNVFNKTQDFFGENSDLHDHDNEALVKSSIEYGVNPELAYKIRTKDKRDAKYILTRISVAKSNIAPKKDFQDLTDYQKLRVLYLVSPKYYTEIAGSLGIESKSLDALDLNQNNVEKYSGKGIKGLLGFIALAELNKVYKDNYNAIFSDPGHNKDFTNMTLREVLAYQKKYRTSRNLPSAAFGRYQFTESTLKDMINRNLIGLDDICDKDFQDRLAILKLKENGIDNFIRGEMSLEDFQFKLAGTWAALPKDNSGLSRYHGDNAGNKARVTHADLESILIGLKRV